MENVSFDTAIAKKIIHTLSFIKKGTAEEIASEIVELDGITTEEGVAEMVNTVKEHAERMVQHGQLTILRSKHASKRYVLHDSNAAW